MRDINDYSKGFRGCTKRLKVTRNRWIGSNRRSEEKFLDIEVKRVSLSLFDTPVSQGWKDGTKLTYAGEGEQDQPNKAPGDLVFVVKTKSHPKFARNGNHLIYKRQISLKEALLGTRVSLEALAGNHISTEVPGVINPRTRKLVANEGK